MSLRCIPSRNVGPEGVLYVQQCEFAVVSASSGSSLQLHRKPFLYINYVVDSDSVHLLKLQISTGCISMLRLIAKWTLPEPVIILSAIFKPIM